MVWVFYAYTNFVAAKNYYTGSFVCFPFNTQSTEGVKDNNQHLIL